MRIFRAFVATIACLLLLGCGASNTTTPSLDPRHGKSTLDATGSTAADTAIAKKAADSENSNLDLRLREQNFRQANFGLDDPGVGVIRADRGGNINGYERKYFAAATMMRQPEVSSYVPSCRA